MQQDYACRRRTFKTDVGGEADVTWRGGGGRWWCCGGVARVRRLLAVLWRREFSSFPFLFVLSGFLLFGLFSLFSVSVSLFSVCSCSPLSFVRYFSSPSLLGSSSLLRSLSIYRGKKGAGVPFASAPSITQRLVGQWPVRWSKGVGLRWGRGERGGKVWKWFSFPDAAHLGGKEERWTVSFKTTPFWSFYIYIYIYIYNIWNGVVLKKTRRFI